MARTVADAPLTTKAARERLAAKHAPYWRAIEGGAAVGYRKGKRGGAWLARVADEAAGGGYRQTTLGRADDTIAADGSAFLDWRQADKAARAWVSRHHRVMAGLEATPDTKQKEPYMVASAIEDHLADLKRRGSRGIDQTRSAAAAHITPALGRLPVGRLTRDSLRAWHQAVASTAVRRRSKKGSAVVATNPTEETDPDAERRRRATANRILTILKAALNHARQEGRVTCSADAWHLVKPFRGVDAPKIRYLSDAESVRLVNACGRDFRDLVTAALLTGCRYGELAAMRATDVDLNAGTVTIPRSKSGKTRHVVLPTEGSDFFARSILTKAPLALLFQRDALVRQATRGAPAETRRAAWKQADQFRPMRAACYAAKIAPVVSFHVLRHTYASRLAGKGVPMAVIAAQIGHADTRMTERHYAHLSPSYVAETVRAAFGTLGLGHELSNVVTLLSMM